MEIAHLVSRWGSASAGSVRFYVLDNEPGLWHETHRDVRPRGVGMDEYLARAIAPNPDDVSTFAALRSSDHALTVMLINKQLSTSATTRLRLSNVTPAAKAQAWQLTSSNRIERLADLSVQGTEVIATLPPQSITLVVVPSSTPQRRRGIRK